MTGVNLPLAPLTLKPDFAISLTPFARRWLPSRSLHWAHLAHFRSRYRRSSRVVFPLW